MRQRIAYLLGGGDICDICGEGLQNVRIARFVIACAMAKLLHSK